ncbi:hypothetical protein [Burkholderia sola]|uniref:hypothetical protein n=1 Tax=Burkholderia sola TaxID=2843302 RepID=UPI0033903F1B
MTEVGISELKHLSWRSIGEHPRANFAAEPGITCWCLTVSACAFDRSDDTFLKQKVLFSTMRFVA